MVLKKLFKIIKIRIFQAIKNMDNFAKNLPANFCERVDIDVPLITIHLFFVENL